LKENSIMKSWKFALAAAALLPASLWAATISGTVSASGAGVAGVKVVLIEGTSTGAHIDSTTTSGTGTYSFANVATGGKTVQASKSGYNSATSFIGISTAGQAATLNLTISINNSTSVVTGTVRRASDSSVLAGATVTLSGGLLDQPRTKTTDSLGVYRFDSVPTSAGYNVSATSAGYQSNSSGNVGATWNSTTTVTTLYLTGNLGTLHGFVRRADSTAFSIVGAKVVVYSGTAKVDSTVTDSLGYTLSLPATSYTFKFSAPGYKSDTGRATKDTNFTVAFGTLSTLNVNLTVATSFVGGTVSHAPNATPVVGAKVVIARRMNGTGAGALYTRLDSTTTDVNGIYLFSNLIAATGTNQAGSRYRVLVSFRPEGAYADYPTTGAQTTGDTMSVAIGATRTFNVTMTVSAVNSTLPGCVVPVQGVLADFSKARSDIRFANMGDRLVLSLAPANVTRTVSIFGVNGSLQHQVVVFAGESKVSVPASFSPANGFLFSVK